MRRSTERILTTHAGSLIRPAPLLQFIGAKQRRQPYDEQAYQDCLRNSVSEIVGRQARIGIDAPSDGEFGKSISWSQYALERLRRVSLRGRFARVNSEQRHDARHGDTHCNFGCPHARSPRMHACCRTQVKPRDGP